MHQTKCHLKIFVVFLQNRFNSITNNKLYTEAGAWIQDQTITLILRNQEPEDANNICAAVSISEDYGRTWTTSIESNLPLNTSKPYCGHLSNGQKYLIGNCLKGANKSREALTIAVSHVGHEHLSKMYLIRDKHIPNELKSVYDVEFSRGFSYPHAIELNDNLYVVYSATHAESGEGRMYWNINDLELAVIPISSLSI